MFLSFDHQTATFFYSCLLGMAIVLTFVLFDCLGKASKKKWWTRLMFDGLFWIVTMVAFFVFFVTVAKGEIRGYLFAGALLGGLLFHLTVGPIVRTVLNRLIHVLIRIVSAPFVLCRRFRIGISSRLRCFFKKRRKNNQKKAKRASFFKRNKVE